MNKSYFIDGKNVKIYVAGDWRNKDGGVKEYSDKNINDIFINAGAGLWLFYRGEFHRAISWFTKEMDLIKEIEGIERKRFHKGYFYYYIAKCYEFLQNTVLYKKYMKLARQQDTISYGKEAKNFPARKKNNL